MMDKLTANQVWIIIFFILVLGLVIFALINLL